MPRTRKKLAPVYRTDRLPSNLTASKRAQVIELLTHYRRGAVRLGQEQWRVFFETGAFDKHHDLDKVRFAQLIGAANRVQMCRYQVVGALQSWLSNRANEFRDTVQASSLPSETRHQLHSVNVRQAWFTREPVAMKDGTLIPGEVRKLARLIMRQVMSRHRRPDLSRISMRLDCRAADLQVPESASQSGAVKYWVHLSTMKKGTTIQVPLLGTAYHARRSGTLANGVQVNLDREGQLTFGVVTDIAQAAQESQAAYQGSGAIALDFGLSTLLGTSQGQLLGQRWLERLRRYDYQITQIAARQQRRGARPRDSQRYKSYVQAIRGFIQTEVGRVFNRLVQDRKPAELIAEKLDFRNAALSRRLNAILRNCGRKAVQDKLLDLNQRFAIRTIEVNPAYTSQECGRCHYVDRDNRPRQDSFCCRWCGHTLQADLNAARVIGQRRALSIGSVSLGKAAVLGELVTDFMLRHPALERRTGPSGVPADPRLRNPYFQGRLKREEVSSATIVAAKSARPLAIGAGGST